MVLVLLYANGISLRAVRALNRFSLWCCCRCYSVVVVEAFVDDVNIVVFGCSPNESVKPDEY